MLSACGSRSVYTLQQGLVTTSPAQVPASARRQTVSEFCKELSGGFDSPRKIEDDLNTKS